MRLELQQQQQQLKNQFQHQHCTTHLNKKKYLQPNFNTNFLLKNDSNKNEKNDLNNTNKYLSYKNLTAYSVDERNYCGDESVLPTTLLKKNTQKLQHQQQNTTNKNAYSLKSHLKILLNVT